MKKPKRKFKAFYVVNGTTAGGNIEQVAERLQTKLDEIKGYSNAIKAHAEQGDVEQCRDTFEALYHAWGGAGDLLNILALPMFEEWFKQYQAKLQQQKQEQGGTND